jgi:hypothetical protein
MKKIFSLLIISWSVLVAAEQPAKIPLNMSPLIMESKTEFTGVVVFRYTKFNTESEYPCMRFETIEPTNNKILETKDYCEITLPFLDNLKIDTKTGVQSVDYSDFQFRDNTFTFVIHLITAIPHTPSFLLSCSLTLDSDKMSDVTCNRKD